MKMEPKWCPSGSKNDVGTGMLSRLFGTPADDINNLKLEFRQTLSRIYRERISRDERYWKQVRRS